MSIHLRCGSVQTELSVFAAAPAAYDPYHGTTLATSDAVNTWVLSASSGRDKHDCGLNET